MLAEPFRQGDLRHRAEEIEVGERLPGQHRLSLGLQPLAGFGENQAANAHDAAADFIGEQPVRGDHRARNPFDETVSMKRFQLKKLQ